MTRTVSDDLLDTLRRKMALRGWVRPSILLPESRGHDDFLKALGQLRAECDIGRGEFAGQWRLRDAARRAVLLACGPDELAALSEPDGDIVTASIARALGAVPFDPDRASPDELAHLRAALSWLPPSNPTAPDMSMRIDQAIGKALIRDDVEHLTRHRIIGRAPHLRKMRDVVGAATDRRATMLSISGSGGIGKSTLLAVFLDQLARERPDIAILRFDFDRADLNPNLLTSLDRALIQQIGQALPGLRARCEEAYRQLRSETASNLREMGRMWESSEAAGALESARSTHSSTAAHFMNLASRDCRQIVLAFDTFERVEAAGLHAVDATLEWASTVSNYAEGPFTLIVAGRTKLLTVPGGFASLRRIELGDLGLRDAIMLLQRRACPPEIARAVVRLLPRRSPLVLHLAAEAILRGSAADHEQLIRELEQGNLAPELVSGYLYKRIFDHIDDPLLRRYVSASLALPELAPELLTRVLVPIVEPGRANDEAHAASLFERMAAIGWLMQPVGEGRVCLQPDLRGLVVELMRSDRTSRALHAEVRARAIEHHRRRRRSPWDAAMLLYHTIMQGQDRGADKAWLAEFGEAVSEYAQYLTRYVDDLPITLRLMLSQREGNEVNLQAAREYLSDEQWRRLMDGPDGHDGHGRELVARQDPLVAHELYRGRSTRPRGLPPAYALQAAFDTARWDELEVDVPRLCDHIHEQISNARRWGPSLLHLAALLRYSMGAWPMHEIPVLQSLTSHLMERCSPYGAGIAVADTVALAEVFHGQTYLGPEFLEKLRPGEQANRIYTLRALHGGRRPDINLTASAVFSFNREPAVPPDGLSPDAFEAIADPGALNGQRWPAFQRWYRTAQKTQMAFRDPATRPLLLLPELYRPLRQAMQEVFAQDEGRLYELAHRTQSLFRIVPHELSGHHFTHFARIDPHTWFYALCEHADRSESLGQLVELCSAIAPRDAERWFRTAQLYYLWSSRLGAN
jgi:hypothetical protein